MHTILAAKIRAAMDTAMAAVGAPAARRHLRGGLAPSDDMWLLVLRATRDPVTICTAACVCRDWHSAAQEPSVWAEVDVGAAVRRYVSHRRCSPRDEAVVRAGRNALQRLKLFRAFSTWRHAGPTADAAGREAEQNQRQRQRALPAPPGELAQVWAPPSLRGARKEAGYNGSTSCSAVQMVTHVSLDADTRTLSFLVNWVLIDALGFQVPNVSWGSTELIFGTEVEFDDDEGEGAYARQMSRTLAELGAAGGTPIDIDDDLSDRKHCLMIHPCRRDEENSIPTVTLRSKLAFHRAHGRAVLYEAREAHQSLYQLPQQAQDMIPDIPDDQMPMVFHYIIHNSPEDAVFEQDAKCQELADEALRRCIGARGDRLSQLVALDLSGLGVSVSLVALVCNAALKSKSGRALATVALNRCAMLDYAGAPVSKPHKERDKAQLAYTELRAALRAHGVSVSANSDQVSMKVVDPDGVEVFFKMAGRKNLKPLFVIYSIRQGGEWFFYYSSAHGGEEVQLKASDSPRRLGMVPPGGDDDDIIIIQARYANDIVLAPPARLLSCCLS
jgi:hypothetical protein